MLKDVQVEQKPELFARPSWGGVRNVLPQLNVYLIVLDYHDYIARSLSSLLATTVGLNGLSPLNPFELCVFRIGRRQRRLSYPIKFVLFSGRGDRLSLRSVRAVTAFSIHSYKYVVVVHCWSYPTMRRPCVLSMQTHTHPHKSVEIGLRKSSCARHGAVNGSSSSSGTP